jgi:Na+/H+ antiporter NhaA
LPAGVALSVSGIVEPITLAVIAGLTIGKPVELFACAQAGEHQLAYVAILRAAGGIGFTMAIFIANWHWTVRRCIQQSSLF